MTDADWNSSEYLSSAREGMASVPGAVLKYRLAGHETALAVVVFESGWSAPFAYGVWLEQALRPHVRVLSYDRAGVGDSRRLAALTAPGVTQQLLALLVHLGIEQPVTIVGHSYGGLLAALHAAQAPERVRAIVQIDPTPEFDDALADGPLRKLPMVGRILQLCALLGIDGPLFMNLASELPPEVFKRIKRERRWLLRSLGGAIAEFHLLEAVRRIIDASAAGKQCPRLVISGTQAQAPASRLQKLLFNEEKARQYWNTVHTLQRRQAERNQASRWLQLPDNHVSLITRRASAHEIAASILGFAAAANRSAAAE